jgi:TRAP transporter TAXI family solute receptor
MMRIFSGLGALTSGVALAAICLGGCGGDSADRQFISIGTAPVGGTFYTIGGAISELLNDQTADLGWRVAAESTGGSMENIRRLDSREIQYAVSNSSITYFAVRGEGGWEKPYDVRAVMTMFPNVAMFVVKANSGIASIGDLVGKRVVVGPQGAGFEYFVRPIVTAHGLSFDDLNVVNAGQQTSVDYLGDGSADATFLGGGVPTGSITSAASSMDIVLLPYGQTEMEALIAEYPFFQPASIPAGTYRGQDEEFSGLEVGSAHIIVHADADEESVYQFTKRLYENREALAEKHRAARAITPENAPRNMGTEFHPGAIRFYREAGIWPQ